MPTPRLSASLRRRLAAQYDGALDWALVLAERGDHAATLANYRHASEIAHRLLASARSRDERAQWLSKRHAADAQADLHRVAA